MLLRHRSNDRRFVLRPLLPRHEETLERQEVAHNGPLDGTAAPERFKRIGDPPVFVPLSTTSSTVIGGSGSRPLHLPLERPPIHGFAGPEGEHGLNETARAVTLYVGRVAPPPPVVTVTSYTDVKT